MEFLTVLFSLLLAVVISVFYFRNFFRGWFADRKKRFHPIATTVYHRILNYDRLHDYMTDLFRKNKTFRIVGPGYTGVYTTDPANVEHILKNNFPNYAKGKHHYDILSGLVGDGIFSVDGEKWRHQRKIASYDFSTKVLRDFSSHVFRSNAVKLASFISDAATADETLNIQDVFMKSTLDSIFKVGFGTDLDTLCGSNEEGRKFAEAFDASSELTFWRYADPLWKLKKRFNVGTEAVLNEKTKALDDFVYKLIKKKREISGPKDSAKKEDMFSRFLAMSEEDPEKMNDHYMRDIILSFVVAGKDSTSLTLSWILYVLCKNPWMQEKIAREVEEATGVTGSTPAEKYVESLTEEAINKMHYLHAALTETLRLYPAIPMDGKLCMKDDTLPDGFNVKKGDNVVYVPYAMGRMKFLWGDDAEVFRPERWIGADGNFRPESPFKFTAFQAGPRICLGREFAYRQMKIFMAVLLRYFRFKLADENMVAKYKITLTLQFHAGLQVLAYHA
ncbi:hypothetical protein ACLOJK_033525 [Asimina triloba]